MKAPESEQDWQLLEKLWNYLCIESELPSTADAIVVGGSGSMVDGADRAAELYHADISPLVVTSGFSNPYLTDGPISEAVLLKNRLTELGVPEDAIIVDELAKNTGDNILNSARLLVEAGIVPKSIILVHKPDLTRRFLATAEAQWPKPQPNLYVTSKLSSPRAYYELQELSGDENKMVEQMIGYYDRIKAYPAQGLSTEQPFSQEVEDAVRELKARGFAGKEMT